MAEPLGTRREGKAQDQGTQPHTEHVGDRKVPWIDWPVAWWDSLLALGSVDKKRIFMSESSQNVALSSLFFSLCFPV